MQSVNEYAMHLNKAAYAAQPQTLGAGLSQPIEPKKMPLVTTQTFVPDWWHKQESKQCL